MSKDTPILMHGNIIIKGASMITRARNATKTTSYSKRLDATKMKDVIKEAKRLIWLNSAKYTTASKQTNELLKPELRIIIRNSSNNINHLHAAKTEVLQQS